MAAHRMNILSRLILPKSRHACISFHLEPLQKKNVTHHSSYWSRYCLLNEWISKTTSFVGSVHHHSDHCQGHYHFHHYTIHLQSLLPLSSRFLHPVWCSLWALISKSPKKWKLIPTKVDGSQITLILMNFSRIMKKSKASFPRTKKYRFTNHGKNKSSFLLHAKKKTPIHTSQKKYRGHSNNFIQW